MPVANDAEPSAIPLSDAERRLVSGWAADCAARGLPLFAAAPPADPRPREAIAGIRDFARGGQRTGRLRGLAWAALAAARERDDPAAAAAARAAGYAAATAFLHALATPHQTNHILAPVVYQALARELAAGGDPGVGDEELRWAITGAPPEVGAVLRRLPVRRPGRTRLSALFHQLDTGLRRNPAPTFSAARPGEGNLGLDHEQDVTPGGYPMDAIAIPAFVVAGLATRVSNADPAGIGAAWQAFFATSVRDQSPDWESDDLYALYTNYASDFTGPYTLLIGYRVRPEAPTPAGLTRLAVPAARYAVIAAAGEQPAATLAAWQAVWAGDLPRAYTVDFDRHDAASGGQRVTLHVALIDPPGAA